LPNSDIVDKRAVALGEANEVIGTVPIVVKSADFIP